MDGSRPRPSVRDVERAFDFWRTLPDQMRRKGWPGGASAAERLNRLGTWQRAAEGILMAEAERLGLDSSSIRESGEACYSLLGRQPRFVDKTIPPNRIAYWPHCLGRGLADLLPEEKEAVRAAERVLARLFANLPADPAPQPSVADFAKLLRESVQARTLDPQGRTGYARRVWLKTINLAALVENPFRAVDPDGTIRSTQIEYLPDTDEGNRKRLQDSACGMLLACMRRGTMQDDEAESILAVADTLDGAPCQEPTGGANVQPEQAVEPVKILRGSAEILEAIDWPGGKQNWGKVRRLNQKKVGPIRYDGNVPWIEKSALLAWWNKMHELHEENQQPDQDQEAVKDLIAQGERRGAGNLAAGDEGLTLAATPKTRTHHRKKRK